MTLVSAGNSVSFKDRSNRVSTMAFPLATAAMLAASRPWRVFRWRHGQAHYSGWYWSATTGGHVVYESRLELARLLLADFDPQVRAIAAQPFCVTGTSGDRIRRHVPDFLLLGADESVTVVNVKPAEQLSRPEVADALAWAGEVFAEHGWRHEVWSSTSPVVLANVRFLSAYRHPDRVDPVLVSTLQREVTSAVFVSELEAGWPQQSCAVRAAALHLVWHGVFRVELEEPLSASTVLERAA